MSAGNNLLHEVHRHGKPHVLFSLVIAKGHREGLSKYLSGGGKHFEFEEKSAVVIQSIQIVVVVAILTGTLG